jgi:hypothetical protein
MRVGDICDSRLIGDFGLFNVSQQGNPFPAKSK